MGAKVIIFGKILNSSFLKGLRHSAMLVYFIKAKIKTAQFHVCDFCWLWIKKCLLKLLTSLNDLLHLAHLCGFSPLWIMMCFLGVPALLNDFLHWAQCAASLQCGSEGDSSDSDICWMTLSIEHMCASSFHCELWGDFWDFQLDWMTFCIQNRCAVFLH